MSSGYGLKTKYGKCYGEYMDVRKCVIHVEDVRECQPMHDDFFECLHKTKEVSFWKKKLIISKKKWLRKIDLKITEKREAYLKENPKEKTWRDKLPF